MAKKHQNASWEQNHYQAPKKNDVPPVPEISKEHKHNNKDR